jgi:hypothetical protein
VLLRELRIKEDALAAEIPAQMQTGKYGQVKTNVQELIDLRKEVEKLMAQMSSQPPPPPKPASTKTTPLVGDTITLGSGVYNFRLNPGETNDKWVVIEKSHDYSFSSSTAKDPATQAFFIVYKDGKMIKVDRADVVVPPGPGPFKLMGGELGAYVKLLIVKK